MSDKSNEIVLNEKNIEILVAKLVPTSEYFERSFQMLQTQISSLQESHRDLKVDMDRRFTELKTDMNERFGQVNERFGQVDKRFEQVDKRFEQVDERFEQVDKRFEQIDKRFEQVDKRFEQVDKRFEQIDKRFGQLDKKLDMLLDRIDTKIDKGLSENRAQAFKLFTFAMVFSAISMAGLLGKLFLF